MSLTTTRALEIGCLFFLSLMLFTWGLSAQEIIGFDSRFYLFAQEMWRNGASWFATTYNQPYPDYTAASTLLITTCAFLFGTLNKFTAVMPTAICASLTLVFTYLIGAQQNKRWGVIAVCFLWLTLTFFKSARSISLDLYPTLITTICFYLVMQNSNRTLWFIYPLYLLGFIFRGPIGLIIPAGVIAVYYLFDLQFKRLFITGLIALCLLVLSTAALLLLAKHVGGTSFMHGVLRMEIVGRMDNHFLPYYFYMTNSFNTYAITYLLAILVLLGLCVSKIPKIQRKFLLKLFGWVLIILLGMSIPDDKKDRYILAISPALALIAAYIFMAPSTQKYFLLLRKLVTILILIFPGILLLAIYNLVSNNHPVLANIHSVCVMTFFSVMQAVNIFIYVRHKNLVEWREILLLGSTVITFGGAYLAVVEPIELYLDSTHAFVARVEALRKQAGARLVFFKESPDGTPIKYLINMPRYERPIFINDETILKSYPAAFNVTSADYFKQLAPNNYHIIAIGSLGHIPIILFNKIKSP